MDDTCPESQGRSLVNMSCVVVLQVCVLREDVCTMCAEDWVKSLEAEVSDFISKSVEEEHQSSSWYLRTVFQVYIQAVRKSSVFSPNLVKLLAQCHQRGTQILWNMRNATPRGILPSTLMSLETFVTLLCAVFRQAAAIQI